MDDLSAMQRMHDGMTLPLYTTALAMRVPGIPFKRQAINFAEAAWPDVFNCKIMTAFIIKMSSV
jgi:hypothetical protein